MNRLNKPICALVCALALCLLLTGCAGDGKTPAEPVLSDSPQTEAQTPAPSDAAGDPTELPTAQTEAPAPQTTAPAEDTPAPTAWEAPRPEWSVTAERSHAEECAEAARAMLEGRPFEPFAFAWYETAYLMDFDGGALTANKVVFNITGSGGGEYYSLCADPVLSLPAELAKDAEQAVLRNYCDIHGLAPDEAPKGIYPCRGYVGGDHLILTGGEVLMHATAQAVFYRDGSGRWSELPCADFGQKLLTGGFVMDADTAWLCFSAFDEGDGSGFAVYSTFDGGTSWQKVSLPVPQEYAGYSSAYAFSPVFDGQRGVMPIEFLYEGRPAANACFLTEDGGESWRFVLPG